MTARINVTLPDELADLVREQMPGLNVSGVLQDALRRLVECPHDALGCAWCGAVVDRQHLEGSILSSFFKEAMWRLQEPVSKLATAEGAARVLRDLAQSWHVPDWDHTPLPRPTKSQRARAHAELVKEAEREELALFESGTKPRRRAAGVA